MIKLAMFGCIGHGSFPVLASRFLNTQVLTSCRLLPAVAVLGERTAHRLLPLAPLCSSTLLCSSAPFSASPSLSSLPRHLVSFLRLLRDDPELCSARTAAAGWADRALAAGVGRAGRSGGQRAGLGSRGGRYIIHIGRNASLGARVYSLEPLKTWRLRRALSTFLLRGGSLQQGDRSWGKMAMTVAPSTGSLSSMWLSSGSRSTRDAIHRSWFSRDPRLVRSFPTRRSSSVSVRKKSRGRFSIVGLSGPGVEGGNGIVQIAEALRSKGERRDRPVLTGASASSSGSSVPGISFTEPIPDEGDGGNGLSGGRGGGGGGGGGDGGHGGSDNSGAGQEGSSIGGGGIFTAFLSGWRSRVRADPQFAFKVLTEEFIGVGACVVGDMASRPNFGLDELDLVFSTIVVGSILNFTLMYMLAPTSVIGPVITKLPGIFASCPTGHMFEVGRYSLLDRFGTFLYKGGQFAVVGFIAGLLGTTLSTSLLNARKKMDPDFVIQNEPPPIFLNAATWAIHMGLSSNARYQTLNGLEFAMAKALPAGVFKSLVFLIRGLNNVLGGTTFVILARLTGSQPREGTPPPKQTTEDDSSLEHAKTS